MKHPVNVVYADLTHLIRSLEPEKVVPILDGMFVWRTVLLVILALAALVGGLYNLLQFGLHTVQPAAIKKFKRRF